MSSKLPRVSADSPTEAMPWKWEKLECPDGTVWEGWKFERVDGEPGSIGVVQEVVRETRERGWESCSRDLAAVPTLGVRSVVDLANVPQHPDDEINLGEPEPSRRRLEDTQQRIRQRIEELQAQIAADQQRMAEIEARLMQLGESPVHTSEHDEEPQ